MSNTFQASQAGFFSIAFSLYAISYETPIFIGLGLGIFGGIVITVLMGFIAYGLAKYTQNKKRKESILQNFKPYLDKLNSIKRKILTNMESLYKETINNIRNYKISQKMPLINIYKNNEEYQKIQNEFKNICIEIENNN